MRKLGGVDDKYVCFFYGVVRFAFDGRDRERGGERRGERNKC